MDPTCIFPSPTNQYIFQISFPHPSFTENQFGAEIKKENWITKQLKPVYKRTRPNWSVRTARSKPESNPTNQPTKLNWKTSNVVLTTFLFTTLFFLWYDLFYTWRFLSLTKTTTITKLMKSRFLLKIHKNSKCD